MPNRGSFLSALEIEALREILLIARQEFRKTAGRLDIVSRANVNGNEFNNFLSRRSTNPESPYKIITPHNTFQKRLVNWLFSDEDAIGLAQSRMLEKQLALLRDKMIRYARIPEEDHDFDYFYSIGAVTATRCEEICDTLAGYYNVYRLSSEVGKMHVSHLEVRPFNRYRKMPTFINRIALPGGGERHVVGHIVEIGKNYMFSGYTLRSGKVAAGLQGEFIGSKVMILKRIYGQGSPKTLMGFYYTSGSQEVYDFGATRAVETNKKYDPKKNAVFDIPIGDPWHELNKARPFPVDDIALRVPQGALIDGKIFSSLGFRMIYARRRSLKAR
jgi:hypothetical protein